LISSLADNAIRERSLPPDRHCTATSLGGSQRTAAFREWMRDAGQNVHPAVVEVMRELDIDLSERTPQLLTHELSSERVRWPSPLV
jgi:protein-tyrosine-phosphatase